MKILILSSGEYGSEIVKGIEEHGFSNNIVGNYEFPINLPEDKTIESLIPKNIHETDLIVSVGLLNEINLVIPKIVKSSNAKSVIIAIHKPNQISSNLKKQIINSIPEVKVVFPKPICNLLPQNDEYIDKFTEVFGKPEIEIEADTHIKNINVIRGAPCGVTWDIAKKLKGVAIEEAELETSNLFHHYPCLASPALEVKTKDSILHQGEYRARESIKKALGFAMKSAVVDIETCVGLKECDSLCLKSCPNNMNNIETIRSDEEDYAFINPVSCGTCEICLEECPYGSIEIYERKIEL